jgi:hypothetical protein
MTRKWPAYGFRISARIKAWLLRRKGYFTVIVRAWVDPDGKYLKNYVVGNPETLYGFGWYNEKPQDDALLAYVVKYGYIEIGNWSRSCV